MLGPQILARYHFTIFTHPPMTRPNQKVVNLSLKPSTAKVRLTLIAMIRLWSILLLLITIFFGGGGEAFLNNANHPKGRILVFQGPQDCSISILKNTAQVKVLIMILP